MFLYYIFRILKLLNRKWYAGVLIIGILLSVLNFLPLRTKESTDMSKYVNQKGILHVVLKGNIYRNIRKGFKVKTLKEFISIAKVYYKDFFLSYFYFIFLISLILSETAAMRIWLKDRNFSSALEIQ